ncbi:MAG: hypothetical protein INQ03_06740 [Candidatus Heimdallarchaeota archaeon]|nr:hypothetical protein [Candidatus Heimdallarchaeota archaeon]
MSVRERPGKKEEGSSIKEPDAKIEENKHTVEVDTPSKQKVHEIDVKSIFESSLPAWVNKPWMYIQPGHVTHLGSWKESWKSVILDYASKFNLHVLNIMELSSIYPFENSILGKQLTKDQLTVVIDEMVNQGLARWLDDYRILVRVYYKTLDQWMEILVSYLMTSGLAAEVITIFELQNMNKEWSTLPLEDFQQIFTKLVQLNRAKWADRNRDSILLVV